ncbi:MULTISPECIES: acyl-homoserine-lactone synthase [unclassified Sphingobium]|uniref:acyl-homoserine-lactone synthase n=1 Tax=unclassified Sphingobium TaxID=2611147 RepID=UPI0035A6892E
MIHIVDNHLAVGSRPLLQSMFADRKRLFVDLFGWDVPVVDGQYEIDPFDTAAAVYVVAADDDGQHEASLRLMPTTGPHMLGALFAHLCPLGVPVGPDIWETTRLCLPQRHGAVRRRELRNALFSATIDFALARGISGLTGLIPDGFRRELLAMGWRAEPLGPSLRVDGDLVGAFMVHVDASTPQRLAWTSVYAPAESAVA